MSQQTKIENTFDSLWSNETIATIRKYIKNVIPTVKVQKEGEYIAIWTSDYVRPFSEQEAIGLYELGLIQRPVDKSNCHLIAFEERAHLLKLWGLLK